MNIKSDSKVYTFSSTSLTVTVSDPGLATCTKIGDSPGGVSCNKIWRKIKYSNQCALTVIFVDNNPF